jgi:hypothetical protein
MAVRRTVRLDERADEILSQFAADNSLSLNAAMNFILRDYDRLQDEKRERDSLGVKIYRNILTLTWCHFYWHLVWLD